MFAGMLRKISAIGLAVALLAGLPAPAGAVVVMPERGDLIESAGERDDRRAARAPAAAKAPAKPKKETPKPVRKPQVKLIPAPDSHYLQGIRHEFQRLNNCGPVTTNMVLGYYGVDLTQDYTAGKLRPNPLDVSVSTIEMVTFADVEYGFAGHVGWGGNMQLLENLIANGIPVIVLQPLDPTSDINHFRLVHGYDRKNQTVTVSDSYLGRNLVWSYEYFRGLWDQRGYSYTLIHPKKDQALVNAITERYQDDEETRRRDGLIRVQKFVDSEPNNPWAWLQLGQTLYRRDRYQEALKAWNRANELGLPEKALWYAPWPAQLMNEVGRYAEARELASTVLANNPGSSEMYYERARAAQEMGDMRAAREDLERAVSFAPYHPKFRMASEQFDRTGRFTTEQRPGW